MRCNMLQLSQCQVHYRKNNRAHLKKKAAGILHIHPEELLDFQIRKRNIDARKKPEIYYSYTVVFSVKNEEELLRKNKGNRNLTVCKEEPDLAAQAALLSAGERVRLAGENIVVVGAGPCGLFAAYYLALCGARPKIIERGAPVEERMQDVERFWKENVLDEESNVSFGEGGAGTFSDGKLNTGVKDRTGRKKFILESFIRFGAGEDIRYDTNPHIGTDVLRQVIVRMRKEMQKLGCQFYFHTKMEKICMDAEGKVTKTVVSQRENGGTTERELDCDRLILAIGHSARDTFAYLAEDGFAMSRKPFAVGVRVQHEQAKMNRIQYGTDDALLPAAPYKVTAKTADGRGVYSFCMCPGGYVVNASTEKNGLVVNGMSNVKRDSGAANSAIVVSVEPEDFEGDDVLAGVRFQRKWEQKMYELCGGRIPVQSYGDFKEDKETGGTISQTPVVCGGWQCANIRKALPKFIINGIIDGMESFQRKLHGFADDDTLLLGIETRTSSPVRIERGEDFESLSHRCVYPCGEGAGYAGGIMSAAMDGLRVAMAVRDNGGQSGR